MTSPIQFQIDASDVIVKFQDMKQEVVNNIQKAVMDSGFMVETEIKESIAGDRGEPRSVHTGLFMATVHTVPLGFGMVKVQSGVDYAEYLEDGTKYIEARHHFANSAERMQIPVKQKIEVAINEAL